MSYLERQRKLTRYLKNNGLGAILVKKKENISYLTGARGDDSLLLVSRKGNILATDARYEEEYERSAKNCSVRIPKDRNLAGVVFDECKKTAINKIGFESEHLSHQSYLRLKQLFKGKKLVPVVQAVENLRAIKDRREISCIKKACIDGERLMNYAIKSLRPGISENRLKRMIEAYALEKGIGPAGFDIIVASGRNSSMPHASSTDKLIRKNEAVTIDLGASYEGYNSDLTRTIFLGKINRKYSHIYEIVLASQRMAIEILRPGVYAKDIDAVSRQHISGKGMGRFFLHSLGHGIGRETHEIPAISQTSKMRLEQGMVITIEPGIYVPGWGGVRIEDTALITKKGCEVLTERAIKHAGRDQ
ncbi:MAG: Xaa-Pro peptidase family protein [Candidatus Omnitrophota bacterium]|nr:Xaa-Pro peptidase family protein [Candidatus Omnitrophota bacterium]